MNFKKITDIPVLEEILEGDMLVVNHDGSAAQINASKVGGRGEGNIGQILYVTFEPRTEGTRTVEVYSDESRETMMTFQQGKNALLTTHILCNNFEDEITYIIPWGIYFDENNLTAHVRYVWYNNIVESYECYLNLHFSDSLLD